MKVKINNIILDKNIEELNIEELKYNCSNSLEKEIVYILEKCQNQLNEKQRQIEYFKNKLYATGFIISNEM